MGQRSESEHPEARCDRCGVKNPVWYAPTAVWREIEIDRGFNGVLCPTCFINDATAAGFKAGGPGWRVSPSLPADELVREAESAAWKAGRCAESRN